MSAASSPSMSEDDLKFMRRIQKAVDTVAAWDNDPTLLREFRQQLPWPKLRGGIPNDGISYVRPEKDRHLTGNALLLQRLCRYFKESMTWINTPDCDKCGSKDCQFETTRGPESEEERDGGASRVEVFKCAKCGAFTTFPRYNSVRKLLKTRSGRCGEYANLFGFLCRAVGFETRYVLDVTDHVWTEVYLVDQDKWIMADGCEGVIDEPSMYEKGWGKQGLCYMIGISNDHVVDLTARYTRQWQKDDFQERRRRHTSSEDASAEIIKEVNHQLQNKLSKARWNELKRQLQIEDADFLFFKQATDWSQQITWDRGRISGSLTWKKSRHEAGNLGIEEISAKEIEERTSSIGVPSQQNEMDGLKISDVETTVVRLVAPYRQASSSHEQIQALGNLAVRVSVSASSGTDVPFLLEEIARFCIIEIPLVDRADGNNIPSSVDCVLDACGVVASLTACVSCLKELAALSSNQSYEQSDGSTNEWILGLNKMHKSSQDRILRTSMYTIRRMLCATTFISEPPRENLLDWFWMTANSMGLANLRSENVKSLSSSTMDSVSSWMDRWVGNVIVLLPQLIANACHALQVKLPPWAVPSRLFPRLVECGLTWYCHIAQRLTITMKYEGGVCSNDVSSIPTCISVSTPKEYVSTLMRHLVHRRDSDHVATGIYGSLSGPPADTAKALVGQRDIPSTTDVAAVTAIGNPPRDGLQMRKNILSNLLQETMSTESPREAAALIRSILQHYLQSSPPSQSSLHDLLSSSVGTFCVPLLNSSWRIQEGFVRLMAFSSTSIQPGPPENDHRLCHTTMLLLSQCLHHKNEARVGDDEDSSCSDFDDTSSGNEDPLLLHVQILLESWSQATFVHRTDRRLQQHVTLLLRYGLRMLCSKDATKLGSTHSDDSNSKGSQLLQMQSLTLRILEGVTCRLESSLDGVRRDGMKVAYLLARNLGEELVFDELDNGSDNDSVDEVMSGDVIGSNSADGRGEKPDGHPIQSRQPDASCKTAKTGNVTSKTKKRLNRRENKPKIRDPDAEYVSDDDSFDSEDEEDWDEGFGSSAGANEDSSHLSNPDHDDSTCWDGEDELVPYNLEDDEEDLRETTRPLSLIDCLSLLRAVESDETAYSQHETGLREVSRLVRSRPADLPDVAVSLSRELIRMENKFNIKDFAQMRHDGLCSLTACEPLLVGQQLIVELFEDGSLFDRLNILSTMNEAAMELCGKKKLEENLQSTEASLEQKPSPKEVEVLGFDSIMEQKLADQISKIESQTRWKNSKLKKTTSQKTFSNEFASIAPNWFYSLVGNFMQRRNDTTLWAGSTGSRLLSHLIFTLATIVESSGSLSPGSRVMADDMFELVWSFRTVEVAEIRSSVLVAVAVSIAHMPSERVLKLLMGEPSTGLPYVLNEISMNDPDESCRSLATSIANSVRQVVSESLQDPGLFEIAS